MNATKAEIAVIAIISGVIGSVVTDWLSDAPAGTPASELDVPVGVVLETVACWDGNSNPLDVEPPFMVVREADKEYATPVMYETFKCPPWRFIKDVTGEILVIEARPPEPAPSPARAEESLGFTPEEIARMDAIREGKDISHPMAPTGLTVSVSNDTADDGGDTVSLVVE